MASVQVVETSVANNSPSQDSNHPHDLFQLRKVCNTNIPQTIFLLKYVMFNSNLRQIQSINIGSFSLEKPLQNLDVIITITWCYWYYCSIIICYYCNINGYTAPQLFIPFDITLSFLKHKYHYHYYYYYYHHHHHYNGHLSANQG